MEKHGLLLGLAGVLIALSLCSCDPDAGTTSGNESGRQNFLVEVTVPETLTDYYNVFTYQDQYFDKTGGVHIGTVNKKELTVGTNSFYISIPSSEIANSGGEQIGAYSFTTEEAYEAATDTLGVNTAASTCMASYTQYVEVTESATSTTLTLSIGSHKSK